MSHESVDIIVPIWNRPVETRACLVSLVQNTADTRLILVDNSSDRETERMLEEFAEALDVRVLFLKNLVNEGFVKAVNRGLSRAESKYVAIVRQNSIVRPGWFEPLYDFLHQTPDCGVVVPKYIEKDGKRSSSRNGALSRGMELSSADFAALLMRRSLYDTAGNFDEQMDGAAWCLKEYSRRCWREGYRTCIVPDSLVEKSEEATLGSAARRVEHEQRIRAIFSESWGEEMAFCLHVPKGSEVTLAKERYAILATAARQGHRIIIITHPTNTSELASAGLDRCHEYITIHTLSRLLPDRSIKRAVAAASAYGLPVRHLSWDDRPGFECGAEPAAFSEFAQIVTNNQRDHYQKNISTWNPGGESEK
ncbi:putative glycosyl transferase [Geobacter sp. OR-1]|uniref:glycosyltransferase family 2 protein n=1 Tax=Geobacter sp. OR-1 TaxID=1266765 RepID=UPI0005437CFA|nr:glycosyltransferase [Geobacter sp. OR-1]GAM08175.1 putative glycosyl transferase [Geobacter sp. OR-1]